MGPDDESGDALSQLTRLFAERAAATGAVAVPEPPDAAPVTPAAPPVSVPPVSVPPVSVVSSAPSPFPLPAPPTAFPSSPPADPPPAASLPAGPLPVDPRPAAVPAAAVPAAAVPAAAVPAAAAPAAAAPAAAAPAAAVPPSAAPPSGLSPADLSLADLPSAGPAPAPAFGGAPIAARRERIPVQSAPVVDPSSFIPPPVSAATAPPVPSVLPQPEPAPPVSAAAVLSAPPAPAPVTAPVSASPPTATQVASTPAAAQVASPPATSAPGQPFAPGGPLLPATDPVDDIDEDELARPRQEERIALILAILLPPIGLVFSIVAAVRSASRRGWVIGLVRAAVAVGIVMSVVAAGGAYAGYKAIRQQQVHDQTVAASAPFCAALKKDPTLTAADGGWPLPAASVPDSVTAMQAFVARWKALAKIAPEGVRQGVASVAAAGDDVIGSVQVSHTIDDAQNRQRLQSAVAASGVAEWRAGYCR